MDGEWITVQTLSNFGGVVFAVTLICQFFKGSVDRMVRMPTRILALLISWAVLLGRRYTMMDALTFDGVYLDLLNGFLVALASMGAHSVAKDNLRWK